MSDIRFSCHICGQHIVCDAEHAGREVDCPSCNNELLIPNVRQSSSSGLQKAGGNRSMRLSAAWSICLGILLGLLVCVLLLFGYNELIYYKERSNPLMREKTRLAWNAMQQVNQDLSNVSGSEFFAQKALRYSQIDMTDADPMLVDHIQEAVGVARYGLSVARRIEQDAGKIRAAARNANEAGQLFVGLLALASGRETAYRDAQVGSLGVNLLTAGIGQSELDKLQTKYREEIAEMGTAYKKLNDRHAYLSEKLSKKYGIPLLNLF